MSDLVARPCCNNFYGCHGHGFANFRLDSICLSYASLCTHQDDIIKSNDANNEAKLPIHSRVIFFKCQSSQDYVDYLGFFTSDRM